MFKVNNKNSRTRCEICSKLTIKIPERSQWRKNLFGYRLEHFFFLDRIRGATRNFSGHGRFIGRAWRQTFHLQHTKKKSPAGKNIEEFHVLDTLKAAF